MSVKPVTIPTKTLASSITSAATSFRLTDIISWDQVTPLTAADFGDQAYCVFRNAARTAIEIIEFDPATIASPSITILRRGLKFTGDLTTEVSTNKLSWTKGDTYVDLGTDTPQLFQWLKEYVDAAIVSGAVPATTSVLGISKLSVAPVSAFSPVVVGDNDPRILSTVEKARTVPFKTVLAGETINGATLPVPVFQNKTDNEFYACDANDNTRYKFLGFAVSDGTNGNPFTVQFSGIVQGFTGLSEGEKYYVTDTVGTISTTPGTQSILVGIAISETELLIQKGLLRAAGAGGSLGTASSSVVITTGFRPSKINIFAASAEDSAAAQSATLTINWCNGVAVGLSVFPETGNPPIVQNSLNLYKAITSASYMTFAITSVTDTGFTVSITETGTFDSVSGFMWEAEGEL